MLGNVNFKVKVQFEGQQWMMIKFTELCPAATQYGSNWNT